MTTAPSPALDVHGASVRLGGAAILQDVDLTVQAGETVALLGANGSGKSTLLRAAVGVVPMESGCVELFGSPLDRRRSHDVLGYVPQDSPEFGSIPATAREVVTSGLLSSRAWFPRPYDPRVKTALEAVGMADLARRPITRMSGGQRRRVMIARALVRDPRLLVLDEPFAGVDLGTQQLLAQLFRDLAARGVSILVVLHEIGMLEQDIDRAVVLDHGHVIHDGAVADRPLMDPGHEHPHTDLTAHDCLGQEIHPA